MTDQETLFEVETPPVKVPKRAKGSGESKPKWTRYRPVNPVKCDDCMLVLALSKGQGPASRQARYRRQHEGSDLLLCHAHTQARRDEDGLKPVKAPRDSR